MNNDLDEDEYGNATSSGVLSGRPTTPAIDYIITDEKSASCLRTIRRLSSAQLGSPTDHVALFATYHCKAIDISMQA